ncbi:MAG: hypothetical protein ABJN22_02005 [Litorimonas sp.]
MTPTIEVETGIDPDIVIGNVDAADQAALSNWIEESVSLLRSQEFESNFERASETYPQVYVSKTQDIIPSTLLLTRLKTEDPHLSALWWPKTYVVLNGKTSRRLSDQRGFGFQALRNAGAGPYPKNQIGTKTGEIELGRLHYARYTQGDIVEKSCAINTMTHEISHTLSDQIDRFWMHILDTETNVTPPRGVFEASYFIGIIAQCTYLENANRIAKSDFESCLATFSDPARSSRFRSIACDDFPDNKPITPQGRLKL